MIWTTPKAVLGVLPVIVILGLWEYSQYCYTTFVGVMSQCQFLTVLGVLIQELYHFSGSNPTKMVCTCGSTTQTVKNMILGVVLTEYINLDTLTYCDAGFKVTQNTFDKMWCRLPVALEY